MANTTGATDAKLPQDQNSVPIQVLCPDYATAANGTAGAASSVITLPAGRDLLLIVNSQDTWVTFAPASGSPTASAGGAGCFLILAGERTFQCPRTLVSDGNGNKVYTRVTKMAIIRNGTSDGAVSVVGLN